MQNQPPKRSHFPAARRHLDPLGDTARNRSRKHKGAQASKRSPSAKDAEDYSSLPAVGTLGQTKRLILAAIRVWELKQGMRG
jgi:hypothetical protein